MNEGQPEEIDELFAAAIQLGPDERAAFFARASATHDPRLLADVEALLTNFHAAEAEGFLSAPFVVPGDSASADLRGLEPDVPTRALADGQVFEGYRIVTLIAEGGMGEVYLAHDVELNRPVAIKLIKGRLKTRELLRRFQNERQILARLQHANIARLFAAGASAEGLPFFVMEHVEGQTIDAYVREHGLPVRRRLELFRTVCAAVAYAHRNLVVHRDLKPGNILVTPDGQPKLLDFGIAKLLQDADAASLDATATIWHAMTPEYASPEQVNGDPLSTATDVYSLGVLLYELLTGRGPYELKRRTSAEIVKAVCREEPPRPSSLPALTQAQSKILRGDLDTIVLKALRKDPERRYAAVEEFSEDIRRHLDGLPVQARPDTFGYRASKFVRRHAIGVTAVSLLLITLAAGVAATSWEARRANRRFNDLRQLAHSVLFDYHDAIAALPGATAVRQQLVQDGLRYLDTLSREAGDDRSLLKELADAYEKVASVQGGGATSMRGTTISASNLGDKASAIQSLGKSLAIRERLVALEPANLDRRNELAFTGLALANLYLFTGPPEKVLEFSDRAIPALESSSAAHPEDEDLRYKLFLGYMGKAKALGDPATANLGDTPRAVVFLNKARTLIDQLVSNHASDVGYQQALGTLYNLSGSLAHAAGNEDQGLADDLKAIEIDRRLVELDPANTLFREELAIQLGNAGSTMLKRGDVPGALEKFRDAQSVYESLMAADPSDASTRRNAAVGYRNLGVALGPAHRAEALANFQKALELFSTLTSRDPGSADLQRQWAFTHLALGRFHVKDGQLSAAVESFRRGISIGAALVAASPTNASARNTLALLYRQLGDANEGLAAASPTGARDYWIAAKAAYQQSLDLYNDMKQKGALGSADAGKPDELARLIARCDQAIKTLGGSPVMTC